MTTTEWSGESKTAATGLSYTWQLMKVWGTPSLPGQPKMWSPYAHGFLYTLYYLNSPKLFYCPGREPDRPDRVNSKWFVQETYDDPWGCVSAGVSRWPDQQNPYIGSGYYYNCHLYPYDADPEAHHGRKYKRMDEYPAGEIFAMDMQLTSLGWSAHTLMGYSWNVVYADSRAVNLASIASEEQIGEWKDLSHSPVPWEIFLTKFLARAE